MGSDRGIASCLIGTVVGTIDRDKKDNFIERSKRLSKSYLNT